MGGYQALPFPRGSTWNQGGGNGITLSATVPPSSYEGKIYEVPDTEHGYGGTVLLRVVRNDTGADITVARKGCEMGSDVAGDFGRKCDRFGANLSGQGVVAKPLDDAYTVGDTIAANDLFYVVEEGPCTIVTESASVSLVKGNAVAFEANGCLDGAACVAGYYPVGTIDENCVATDTNVVVNVQAGLRKPPAAG